MQKLLIAIATSFTFYAYSSSIFSGGIETIMGVEGANLKQNSLWNPKNSTYKFYEKNILLDLRPSIEVNPIPWGSAKLRPRLEAKFGSYDVLNEEHSSVKSDLWLNEGYLSFESTDYLQVHLGRQVFLWGPSEVISPSNIFYRDVLNQFNPLFQIRGVTLVRANLNFHDRYNVIFLSELKPWDDSEFEMRSNQEDYKQRFLIKPEYNSASGNIVVGLTYGKKDSHDLYGSYAHWTINSALQLYYDFRLEQIAAKSNPFYVTGIRWTFNDGTEWRHEYIYKRLGYNKNEFEQLNLSMQNPIIADAARNLIKQNSDNLLAEEYYYSSLRFSLTEGKYFFRPILGLRSFYSISSNSGLGSVFFEAGVSDALTITTYLAQSYGPTQGELNQLVNTVGGVYLHYNY